VDQGSVGPRVIRARRDSKVLPDSLGVRETPVLEVTMEQMVKQVTQVNKDLREPQDPRVLQDPLAVQGLTGKQELEEMPVIPVLQELLDPMEPQVKLDLLETLDP